MRTKVNPDLDIVAFVPCKFHPSDNHDRNVLADIQEHLPKVAKVYEPLRKATAFSNASEKSLPLALYDKKHSALSILDTIAADLEALL